MATSPGKDFEDAFEKLQISSDSSSKESEADSLYRVVRDDENIETGLVAKDPDADKSVNSHVNSGGKKGYESQYISTSDSFKAAKEYRSKVSGDPDARIVIIDKKDLDPTTTVIDLTTQENRDEHLKGVLSNNYATKYGEVLLQSENPIQCKLVQEDDADS